MTNNEVKYEKYDECYATVIDRCRTGVFLELDNGQQAFAYDFLMIHRGSKVICSVEKLPQEGRRMEVKITSVAHYAPAAA